VDTRRPVGVTSDNFFNQMWYNLELRGRKMKMKQSSIELKQYAPTWTQSLTAVDFTITTVFVGNLSAQDKNSATESNQHLPANRTRCPGILQVGGAK
jgi:hypothetical protein